VGQLLTSTERIALLQAGTEALANE
jgi:hypothetical protein